jgi:predicted nucleic acid-binding protein
VKFFYDTSVLLPSFFVDHERHEASLSVFLKADKTQGCCAAHTLAELYATATRLPGKLRLSGDQVLLFVENIYDRLAIVTLSDEEYRTAMKDAAAAGIAGGTIYDALLLACAVKAGAEVIYTWNVKHFQQFAPEIAKRVRTP